ncbi:MAG: HTH domain-containing protein [Treponema sp.]|nr:HTH domain-containing protein [Treponema sp.]
MNFMQFAERIIKEANKPLSPKEIWENGVKKGYDKQLNSTGKTPWETISARLYVDIKDNPDSIFIKITTKPVRFFLKNIPQNFDLNKIEKEQEGSIVKRESGYSERDLHKYLSYYVYTYNNFIYTKTIYHETSSKKKYSQWIHPDIVGVYFTFEQWEPEIFDISKEVGNLAIRLFSYELKKVINFSNLRESFFQAVSNSSWANEGYLVTAELDDDKDLMEEIKRLSNSFGIGLIKLNVDNPDSTEIIYPAKQKDIIDIETMNKISQINPDFEDFLKRIKIDLNSKEIRKEKYDKIYDVEELLKKIK